RRVEAVTSNNRLLETGLTNGLEHRCGALDEWGDQEGIEIELVELCDGVFEGGLGDVDFGREGGADRGDALAHGVGRKLGKGVGAVDDEHGALQVLLCSYVVDRPRHDEDLSQGDAEYVVTGVGDGHAGGRGREHGN